MSSLLVFLRNVARSDCAHDENESLHSTLTHSALVVLHHHDHHVLSTFQSQSSASLADEILACSIAVNMSRVLAAVLTRGRSRRSSATLASNTLQLHDVRHVLRKREHLQGALAQRDASPEWQSEQESRLLSQSMQIIAQANERGGQVNISLLPR